MVWRILVGIDLLLLLLLYCALGSRRIDLVGNGAFGGPSPSVKEVKEATIQIGGATASAASSDHAMLPPSESLLSSLAASSLKGWFNLLHQPEELKNLSRLDSESGRGHWQSLYLSPSLLSVSPMAVNLF